MSISLNASSVPAPVTSSRGELFLARSRAAQTAHDETAAADAASHVSDVGFSDKEEDVPSSASTILNRAVRQGFCQEALALVLCGPLGGAGVSAAC